MSNKDLLTDVKKVLHGEVLSEEELCKKCETTYEPGITKCKCHIFECEKHRHMGRGSCYYCVEETSRAYNNDKYFGACLYPIVFGKHNYIGQISCQYCARDFMLNESTFRW